MWQQPRDTVMNANLPLISVRDLNADGAEDFAVLSYDPEATLLTPVPVQHTQYITQTHTTHKHSIQKTHTHENSFTHI